jgi:hypothetical protein
VPRLRHVCSSCLLACSRASDGMPGGDSGDLGRKESASQVASPAVPHGRIRSLSLFRPIFVPLCLFRSPSLSVHSSHLSLSFCSLLRTLSLSLFRSISCSLSRSCSLSLSLVLALSFSLRSLVLSRLCLSVSLTALSLFSLLSLYLLSLALARLSIASSLNSSLSRTFVPSLSH